MTNIPAGLARVPNLLSSSILLETLQRTQRNILAVQIQLATGQRINRASDDPLATSLISVLDDVVERRDQRLRNMSHAEAVLNNVDAALADATAGIIGAFGVNSQDLRDFEDASGPEVDAVEGYLMALRRERVREVGLLDEKFRFYRHLDLDYSLTCRERGYHNRIVPDLPIRRHAHSDWERTPEEERDRLSKRNFYRFLKKHGDRTDLLLANAGKT